MRAPTIFVKETEDDEWNEISIEDYWYHIIFLSKTFVQVAAFLTEEHYD